MEEGRLPPCRPPSPDYAAPPPAAPQLGGRALPDPPPDPPRRGKRACGDDVWRVGALASRTPSRDAAGRGGERRERPRRQPTTLPRRRDVGTRTQAPPWRSAAPPGDGGHRTTASSIAGAAGRRAVSSSPDELCMLTSSEDAGLALSRGAVRPAVPPRAHSPGEGQSRQSGGGGKRSRRTTRTTRRRTARCSPPPGAMRRGRPGPPETPSLARAVG